MPWFECSRCSGAPKLRDTNVHPYRGDCGKECWRPDLEVSGSQAQSVESEDALHVRKPHLDFCAFPARLFVSLSLGQRTGDIAGILMQIARCVSHRRAGKTPPLEGADIAIAL